MSQPERLPAVDLFDDPAWDSPEGQEDVATYERFSRLLPSWAESIIGTFGIGMFALYLVSLVMLFATVADFFSHILDGFHF
jgi:hypothetical protein